MARLHRNRQVCRPLGSAMFPGEEWTRIARALTLTKREIQIVSGIFDDDTEFAIAANLGISRRTVHTHCERLYLKLGVHDRVNLILRVIEEAFVRRPPMSAAPFVRTKRDIG